MIKDTYIVYGEGGVSLDLLQQCQDYRTSHVLTSGKIPD